MALQARKVAGAFEKQAPRPLFKEIIHELHNIRSDSSTGPDNIPANMIKMVADYLGCRPHQAHGTWTLRHSINTQ